MWDLFEKLAILPRHFFLHLKKTSLKGDKADVIIWPETAYPLMLERKELEKLTEIIDCDEHILTELPYEDGKYGKLLIKKFPENSKIVNSLYKKFIPEGIIISINDDENMKSLLKYPFFEGKEFSDKTSVTICKNFSCSLPMFELEKIEELL